MISWMIPALAASAVSRDKTTAALARLASSFLALFLARPPGRVDAPLLGSVRAGTQHHTPCSGCARGVTLSALTALPYVSPLNETP